MLALTAVSQTAPPSAQPKTPPAPTQSAPAPQAPAQQTPPPAAPPQQTAPSPAPTTPATPATPPATPSPEAQPAPRPAPPPSRVAIVLDPSHGGDERGAALSDKLNEKDVVLSLARRVRAELTRAGVPVTMLRDSDVTLDTDQRAQMTNASRPLLYVALHASSIGTGLRIYTTVLPELQPAPGSLVRWQRAQQDWLDASHAAAESIAADLDERQVSATTLATPLPPLNSVTAAAIAVEVAPPPGGRATADMLSSAQYQQRVAAALAAALANARRKIGAPAQPVASGPAAKSEAPQ
jgi:N-acetylmuramoyl-L-alanine amidase